MEYEHYQSQSPSFRQKLKASICNSCCFLSNQNDNNNSSSMVELKRPLENSPMEQHQNQHMTKNSPSSPSSSIKSRANDFVSEEIKDKCFNLFNRISKHGHGGGRKGNNDYCSSEFRYDPFSYALNFDDDSTRFDEYPPLRDFSARLPQSPPRKANEKRFPTAGVVAATPREVAAWS